MKGLKELARGRIVRQKLVKTSYLLIFMVAVSLIGATPVAAQSMDGVGSNSGAAQEDAPVLPCCLTPGCPLSTYVAANVPPAPDRLTLSKAVCPVRLTANLHPPSLERQGTFHQDAPMESSGPPGARYRCRSSLSAEEPPQT